MILDTIQSNLKEAMLAKDELKTSTLRFLLSQIHNREIDLYGQGKNLTDEEVVQVLQKQAKERRESIDAFKQNGREDLVRKEEGELEILNKYLPRQMDSLEVERVVDEVLGEIGAVGITDFGRVMKAVMEKLRGQADGSIISAIVKKKLT